MVTREQRAHRLYFTFKYAYKVPSDILDNIDFYALADPTLEHAENVRVITEVMPALKQYLPRDYISEAQKADEMYSEYLRDILMKAVIDDPEALEDIRSFGFETVEEYARRLVEEDVITEEEMKDILGIEEEKPEEMNIEDRPYIYKSPRPLSPSDFPEFFKKLENMAIYYTLSEDLMKIGTDQPIPPPTVDRMELKLVKTPLTMPLTEFALSFQVSKEDAVNAIVKASREDLLHDVAEAIKISKSYNKYMVESSTDAIIEEAKKIMEEEKPEEEVPKPEEIPPELEEIEQMRRQFNELKEQLESFKKKSVEEIDIEEVKRTDILGELRELQVRLKEMRERSDIEKVVKEAKELEEIIDAYRSENVGWLSRMIEDFVREFLRERGITSEKLVKWILSRVVNIFSERKEIPKTKELEEMFSKFKKRMELMYTDKETLLKEIAREVSRTVEKETGLTYYRYDPQDLIIRLDDDFITVQTRPVYGVTYSYSYPRLTVEELQQLGIEPVPDKWVEPPVGWKPEEKEETVEEKVKRLVEQIRPYLEPVYRVWADGISIRYDSDYHTGVIGGVENLKDISQIGKLMNDITDVIRDVQFILTNYPSIRRFYGLTKDIEKNENLLKPYTNIVFDQEPVEDYFGIGTADVGKRGIKFYWHSPELSKELIEKRTPFIEATPPATIAHEIAHTLGSEKEIADPLAKVVAIRFYLKHPEYSVDRWLCFEIQESARDVLRDPKQFNIDVLKLVLYTKPGVVENCLREGLAPEDFSKVLQALGIEEEKPEKEVIKKEIERKIERRVRPEPISLFEDLKHRILRARRRVTLQEILEEARQMELPEDMLEELGMLAENRVNELIFAKVLDLIESARSAEEIEKALAMAVKAGLPENMIRDLRRVASKEEELEGFKPPEPEKEVEKVEIEEIRADYSKLVSEGNFKMAGLLDYLVARAGQSITPEIEKTIKILKEMGYEKADQLYTLFVR